MANLLLATVNFEPCGRPSFACPKINILRNILALYPLFTDVPSQMLLSNLLISNTDISKDPLKSKNIVWTYFLFFFTFQPLFSYL